MKRIRYRGDGTGLRLEHPDDPWQCLDITGSRAQDAPMQLTVCDRAREDGSGGEGATIALEPADVVLVIEACSHYLARHFAVPEARA